MEKLDLVPGRLTQLGSQKEGCVVNGEQCISEELPSCIVDCFQTSH